MTPDKTIKPGPEKRKDRATEVANTLEWLITAFILAFVFRAFVMEAFRIPTGSMADTLKGAHFRLCCPQCGYKYDYGFVPENYGLPPDSIPRMSIRPVTTRCPNCGHYQAAGGTMPIANGDRILVLKCIYQFYEPKRWDVVVFKNPTEPPINYIKRLVGCPGERIEIIDGDVYIENEIARKPAKVQEELWMPVYDNDYQPVRPREGVFNGHTWQQPFKNIKDSKWALNNEDKPTIFYLNSSADEIHSFFYDTSVGNDFRATYAYDDLRGYNYMPYCSDLMVRFCVNPAILQGGIGATLSKYNSNYKAWVDFSGKMVITETYEGKETILNSKSLEAVAANKPTLVKFANVDHELIFQFGNEELTYDLGRGPNDAGPREADRQPQVEVFSSGKLALSHIAIFRDIHYTAQKYANSPDIGRATEGNPFTLKEDEFFVLGDNSPNSEDARWWSEPGVANKGLSYREGVVPRDYLVGKALFVYWPSGFKAFSKSRFSIIPNVGQLRFIYGGSSKKPQ